MNLKRLGYFVAVADELHFGRAAERLHMAQPPLSQQIRRLEADLEVSLFDRTTRRVSLTDAGRLLYPHAVQVLAASADAEAAMAAFRSGETGLLRLGFVDSASYDLMPRFLRSYREELPAVEFELRTLSSDQQHQALLDREIDLGIGRVHRPDAGVEATPVIEERLLLAVPTGHRFAEADALTVADTGGEVFVGFDRSVSPSLFQELVTMFARAGRDFDPIIEATEYATVLGLVASGQGIAVVPASVQTFTPPGLGYVPLDDTAARSSLVLLSRTAEPSRLVTRAIDLVTRLFP